MVCLFVGCLFFRMNGLFLYLVGVFVFSHYTVGRLVCGLPLALISWSGVWMFGIHSVG